MCHALEDADNVNEVVDAKASVCAGIEEKIDSLSSGDIGFTSQCRRSMTPRRIFARTSEIDDVDNINAWMEDGIEQDDVQSDETYASDDRTSSCFLNTGKHLIPSYFALQHVLDKYKCTIDITAELSRLTGVSILVALICTLFCFLSRYALTDLPQRTKLHRYLENCLKYQRWIVI